MRVPGTTTITHQPIDTVVRVNRTAFFHCEASYNPAIDITYDWYHNDYKIQFVKIRVIGDTQHVEIEEHFERVSRVVTSRRRALLLQWLYVAYMWTYAVYSISKSIMYSCSVHVLIVHVIIRWGAFPYSKILIEVTMCMLIKSCKG